MQRDDAYLLDMLLAARRARRFCEGITWEEIQRAHPEIPWGPIARMRNRLIHEYFRIDLPTVWQTVRDEIAPLVAQLEPLVPPERP
jgi:uncharacterized protein with HEPN domain